MSDPRIPLRDQWLAVMLAFVLPGLGHLYQRRVLKSVLFFVCIVGLFGWGMTIAEGKAVNYRGKALKDRMGFFAQAGTGLLVWPALWQHSRYHSPDNSLQAMLSRPLVGEFAGEVDVDTDGQVLQTPVTGVLDLRPETNDFDFPVLVGTLQARFEDGREETFQVDAMSVGDVAPLVNADRRRGVTLSVRNQDGMSIGSAVGSVPRSFKDWWTVPLSKETERDIHGRLGTTFELAYVLCMVAGMLNILVALDAFAGPGYGYDLEPPSEPK